MTRWTPAPFVGGAYSDDSKEWSAQDTVNYIVVNAEREGTRSPTKLRGVPGMVLFADLGTGAPIRGAHNCEGLLLVVSGRSLFKVAPSGASTLIGTIPGASRVSMAHNQYEGGYQVAIANGTGGYVYNTLDDSLVQITDEGFPGAISFDYVDSYITGIEPGKRFAFTSQLADATDYNTLDRQEAEGSPDLLVGQLVTHREWWLFSKRSIEPYVNTGANTGTFQRASGVFIERGAASTHCMVALDNAPFWVGDDGIVYRANGYTPQRISTVAIEHALAQCDLSRCFAFTFEDEGHKVYYLTCPDGQTWGYDVQTQEWHRRQSYGLNRWRVSTLTKWNDLWIAGDYQNGKLYTLDWDVQSENGLALERRRITGVMSDTENALIVNAVRLVVDTGMVKKAVIKLVGDLPNGTAGDVISYQYQIIGGLPPFSAITVVSGDLPPGITLSPDGLATGTYVGSGTYTWRLSVIDSQGNSATLDDSATVTGSIYSAIAEDNPLLYWPLTETSGAKAADLSGNGYDGASHGGSHTVNGFVQGAWADGVGAYLGSASGSPLDVGTTRQWAIEAVVTRGATQPYTNVEANIATQWLSQNFGLASIGLSMVTDGAYGSIAFRGYFTRSGLGGRYTIDSASPPVAGHRTHIVAERVNTGGTYDTLNIYINGALSNTDSSTLLATEVGPHSTGEQFCVASAQPRVVYGWLGTTEHVAVYAHSLGAARALYHAQLLGLA